MALPVVLIVDDNALAVELISQLFEDRFEVLSASNGALGIEAAKAHKPDLILMDLTMPVMDGWTAIRALRAEWSTCRIPIIALSGNRSRTDVKRAVEAGADAHVGKPIEEDELFEHIERLLGVERASAPSGVRVKRLDLDVALRGAKKTSSEG